MNLKKIGKVFTSKFVVTGPSFYKKRIYRAAVSQRLRNTILLGADVKKSGPALCCTSIHCASKHAVQEPSAGCCEVFMLFCLTGST